MQQVGLRLSYDAGARRSVLQRCLEEALAFDPASYFEPPEPDVAQIDVNSAAGIVDARFWAGRRGAIWAFAIDFGCPGEIGFPPRCAPDQQRPLLRAVTWKTAAELAPGWRPRPPSQSAAGEQAFLRSAADWREADITACPGVAAMLLSLDQVWGFSFDESDRSRVAGGKQPTELVVTADGDMALVRARGWGFDSNVTRDAGEPGGVGDWAKKMMASVEPCLKPTTAPAPWER